MEYRPRPEEDEFQEEIPFGKGTAEVQDDSGDRGEPARDEVFFLEDAPNHDGFPGCWGDAPRQRVFRHVRDIRILIC